MTPDKMIAFGRTMKVRLYGGSHEEKIGMIMEGIEEGLPVDEKKLSEFMARRAPGKNPWSTPRKEEDKPVFISGTAGGYTTGEVIEAIIYNRNVRSSDYDNVKRIPRPAHADYPAWVKYGEIPSGGGIFSGRMTAVLCVAGGLCRNWLEEDGITVKAHIKSIGDVTDADMDEESTVGIDFGTVSREAGDKMKAEIEQVRKKGDSIGGVIECKVFGMPVGVGEPLFGSLEGAISQAVFGVPAVKGIEFGSGFEVAAMRGSENNDPFCVKDGMIKTESNRHGGILGGLTSGMPVSMNVAIKPTPSIGTVQRSVDLVTKENTELIINGRHDPCIVPRAVPCIEAAVAIAVYDVLREWRS